MHRAVVAAFPVWERLGPCASGALPPSRSRERIRRTRCSSRLSVRRHRLAAPSSVGIFRTYFEYAGEVEILFNAGMSLVDAAVHAMVRHHKPRKIVEIGSGHSTGITAAACLLNARAGDGCEFVATSALSRMPGRLSGLTRLRVEKCQQVELRSSRTVTRCSSTRMWCPSAAM